MKRPARRTVRRTPTADMEPIADANVESDGECELIEEPVATLPGNTIDFKLASERCGQTLVIFTRGYSKDKCQLLFVGDGHCVGKDWPPTQVCQEFRKRMRAISAEMLPEPRRVRDSKALVATLRKRAVEIRDALLA